jgi:uncharacterized protein (TIGR03067 family)
MNYKNIALLLLGAASVGVPRLSQAAEEKLKPALGQTLVEEGASQGGAISLFDGKDLAGWSGDPRLWSVKDGAITGQTTPENPAKGNTFLIWTNGTVDDFELRCSFKIIPNNDKGFANSGIQYRSKVLDANNWVVGGYQADMEAGPTYTGILYEERMTRGIMATRGEKVVWTADCNKQVTGSFGSADELGKVVKQGDWNDYVVIAKGNHLQHFINGKQTVDVTDDCESKRAMSGVLALQLHAGQPMTVQFRDMRLRKLSSKSASADEDIQKLQGVWQATSGQANGDALPSEMIANIVLTVNGTNYTSVIGERNDKGTLSIDSTKQPREMDVHSETGDNTHLVGIYETGVDHLRLCFATEGPDRPKSFSKANDQGYLLIDYKRKKE